MYAIIETSGTQFRVEPGDVVDMDRLQVGDDGNLSFEQVLAIGGADGLRVGSPYVDGARVTAELVEDLRGKKITVFKKKRRKGYSRKAGFRAELSRVRILDIEG